ncbi:Ig-like domain-containing protein [Dyadobacter sp. LHD-138]|uniref:Ig-like domain-containing protein n=1 Tax=Dyadobacter sp. LHD-138 TaxID=3071413 RepID=UPI0027DFAD6C|nr:Ig-like domain-containing protein [Dyadobacter sp. LHD-138]MDQ6481321.1 Ig-like domain-containing protein [Dyadobacter sp. LHD-138]
MKNFYLFLAGLALLASGVPFLNNTKDGFLYDVLVSEKAEKPAEAAIKQLAYSPLTKSRLKSHALVAPTISATNVYALTNDTGLPGASAGDELEYTVTINNSGTDAAGVKFTEQIDPNTTLVPNSLKVSPIAVNETYTTIGNAGLNVLAANGVLANDISPNGAVLSISGSTTIPTTEGGSVTMNLATGAFVYEPKAGFTGADTFTYTLQNGSGLTAAATVTITSSGMIWFIKEGATAVGANGTFAKPFPSLATFQAINNNTGFNAKTGHTIFIYSGTYDGSLTLLASQKLIGQASAESLSTVTGITIPIGGQLPGTGGTAPALTSSGSAVTVGSGNTIRGLNIGNTTANKITGSNYGTLRLKEMSLSGNGRALNLVAGTLDATLTVLSAVVTGATSGIDVTATNGTLTATSGSVSAGAASAINISGKAANDRLAITLPFTAVSSNGATKGVSVSNTSGTFQILGNNTDLGSGGTIQNISARGLEFINANGITIKNINLTNANTAEGADGGVPSNGNNTNSNAPVYANNVVGLTMDRIIITGTTVQQGINLTDVTTLALSNSSVAKAGTPGQAEEGCIYAVNTQGTNTITSCTFSNPAGRVAYFRNTSKNLALLTVTGSTFQNSPNNSGLLFEGYGTAIMSLKVLGNSQFLACQTDGVEVYGNENAQMFADIRASVMNNQGNAGKGIEISGSGSASVKFNVIGNTAYGKNGTAINMFANANAYLEGTVEGNTIEKNGGGGSGIFFDAEGPTAKGVIKIHNNLVKNIESDFGVGVSVKSVNTTRSDVTISNNTINVVHLNAFYNIDVNAVTSYVNNKAKICANIADNTVTTVTNGIYLRAKSGIAAGTEVLLQGEAANVPEIWNLNGNLPGGATSSNVLQSGAGTFTFNQTCATPNVADLRVAAPEELAENARKSAVDSAAALSQKSVETVAPVAAPAVISTNEVPNEAVSYEAARTEAPLAGETVTVDGVGGAGFALPAAKSVTIKFKVLINANIPVSTCLVSTQGTVSGTGFTSVLTDDPGKAGLANPTDTPVVSAPVVTCPANVSVSPDAGTCTATLSPVATAQGCPVPTITYRVAGNVITFPYVFPAGVTTVAVTAANGIGSNALCSFTVTVTPTPAPVIDQNPVAKSICVGGNTTFAVTTAALNVTYQWQKKPFGGAFANITIGQNATATSATLSLSNIPVGDNLSEYRCIITNACTNASTSNAAVLTVNQITSSSLTGTTSTEKGKPAVPVTFGAVGGTLPYAFSYKINNGPDLSVSTTGGQSTAVVNQPTTTEGTFVYSLKIVTDNQGCTFTPSPAQSATVSITPALPVTLVDFTASKSEKSVLLQWKTTLETNSEKFDVEHSQDGKNWNVVGTRESKGESTVMVKYSFTHNEPTPGENLYRLKMIDKDQTYAYSRIVSVSFDNLVKSVLYPNPVTDQLFLNSADWNKVSAVEIHNLAGNLVYRSGKNVSKTISVKDLPVGMYIVSVIQKTGAVDTHKVVVNR